MSDQRLFACPRKMAMSDWRLSPPSPSTTNRSRRHAASQPRKLRSVGNVSLADVSFFHASLQIGNERSPPYQVYPFEAVNDGESNRSRSNFFSIQIELAHSCLTIPIPNYSVGQLGCIFSWVHQRKAKSLGNRKVILPQTENKNILLENPHIFFWGGDVNGFGGFSNVCS